MGKIDPELLKRLDALAKTMGGAVEDLIPMFAHAIWLEAVVALALCAPALCAGVWLIVKTCKHGFRKERGFCDDMDPIFACFSAAILGLLLCAPALAILNYFPALFSPETYAIREIMRTVL